MLDSGLLFLKLVCANPDFVFFSIFVKCINDGNGLS